MSEQACLLLLLSEATAVRLLLRAWRRQETIVLGITPQFGLSRSLLEAVVRWLVSRGRVRWAADAMPHLRYHYTFKKSWVATDLFERVEPWIERYFRFAEIRTSGWRWWLPYHKVVCNDYQWALQQLMVLADLPHRDGGYRVVCSEAELAEMFAFRHPDRTDIRFDVARSPRRLVNALFGVLMGGLATLRVLARIRPGAMPPEDVAFATDYINPKVTLQNVRDIVDPGTEVMIVYRNRGDWQEGHRQWPEFRHCRFGDGRFSPGQALACLVDVWRGVLSTWRHAGWVSPALYFSLAKFPLHKAAFVGLTNKYRFKHFWARDDYNVEHMFRVEEIRKGGGISMGVCHGQPSMPVVDPVLRYLDFDYYYVIGKRLFDEAYARTYPPSMIMREVGAYTLSRRDTYAFLDARRNPDEIVCFTKPHMDGTQGLAAAIDVADAFPERTVWVKIKLTTKGYAGWEEFEALLRHAPANLRYTEEDSYGLLQRCLYAFSGVTTLVEEGIYYRNNMFFFDCYLATQPIFYRKYPDICISSGAEMIAWIHDMESGRRSYPRASLAGLSCLTDRTIFDVVRQDIGLSPLPRPHTDATTRE